MRIYLIIFTLVLIQTNINAQQYADYLISSPSIGQAALANDGYIIPFKFGATKSSIDEVLGNGTKSTEYKGRFKVTYQNRSKELFHWEFVEIAYMGTGSSARIEAYTFYFDKFDFQDKIFSFFHRPSMIYSECSIEVNWEDPKTGKRGNYTIKCMDYFEFDRISGSTILHKLMYDYPYDEADHFGKVAISYMM
jgi:hypothetical protein